MNTKKIKLMIDGNYVFHIHEYLKECHNKYIEWGAFKDYIKYFISKHENQDISSSSCDITTIEEEKIEISGNQV